MKLDKNAYQSQLPSLEEGPMRSQSNDETYFNRVKKNFNYPRCMDIIKVLLYLELIVFIVWIGGIFITNLYLDRSYNADNSTHGRLELTHDPKTVNLNITSYDDIKPWIKYDDEIVSAEQSQTPITTVTTVRNDFVETETTTFSSKSETEGSDRDPLLKLSEYMNIPIVNDDISSDKSKYDSQKEEIALIDDSEDSPAMSPSSGLIHVVVDHVPDMNVESETKVDVPFPLPLWLENYKTTTVEIPRVVDTSNDEAKMDSMEKTIVSNEDLGNPPAVSPKFGFLLFINMTLNKDDKSLPGSVGSDLEENMSPSNDFTETETEITSSNKLETEGSEENITLWEWFQKMDLPKITVDINYGSAEEEDRSDTSKSDSSIEEIGFNEDLESQPALFRESDITDVQSPVQSDVQSDYDSDVQYISLISLLERYSFLQDPRFIDDVADFDKTEESDEEISSWELFPKQNTPIINNDIKNGNVEQKESSDESNSDSPKDETVLTDDVEDSLAKLLNSGLIRTSDDQVFDENTGVPFPLWLEKNETAATVTPIVEDDSSSDKSEDHSTEKTKIFTEDLESSTPVFSTPAITDVIEDDDSDMKDMQFSPQNLRDISQSYHYLYDTSVSDVEPDVPTDGLNPDEDLSDYYLNTY